MTRGLELHLTGAAVPTFAVAAAILILGIVVIVRERPRGVSISFLILTTSVSTWLFSVSLMTMVGNAAAAFVLARIAYCGIAIIPAAVLQFTLALLGSLVPWRRWLVAAWGSSGAFLAAFTTTRWLLAGTWRYSWGFYPRLTVTSASFLVFFCSLLAVSLGLLMRTPATTAQERYRHHAFCAALAVGYLGSIDYLPAFGVDVYPIGCVAILGFIVLAVRTVVQFRLADLTPSSVAAQLLETMDGGVIVIDRHGRVQVANEVAARLLGWSRGELQHADLPSLLGVFRLPVTDNDSFARRDTARHLTVNWRRRDGSDIELSVSASALRDQNRDVVGVLYAVADLSDRRRADRNEYGATHDPLTTLSNRAGFARDASALTAKAKSSSRIPAVFFVDLDGFKAVNDKHGHDAGDALLQIVATRLRRAIRGEDLLARYGGDEFVLLLNLARTADATLVGNKLVRVLSEPYAIADQRLLISASVGVAFYPDGGDTIEALIRTADGAMYGAKRAGKARLHVSGNDTPSAPLFGSEGRA